MWTTIALENSYFPEAPAARRTRASAAAARLTKTIGGGSGVDFLSAAAARRRRRRGLDRSVVYRLHVDYRVHGISL